jgi:hypothetical protein
MEKRGQTIAWGSEGLPGWLLVLIGAAIMLAAYLIISGKFSDFAEFIKNLFTFGG